MILSTWIIAFGVLIVTWFGSWGRFGLDVGIGSCSILPDVHNRSPKVFLFVVAFLIPCIAIVVCYARIFYIVRKTTSKSRKRNANVTTDAIETIHEVSVHSRGRKINKSIFSSSSPIKLFFALPFYTCVSLFSCYLYHSPSFHSSSTLLYYDCSFFSQPLLIGQSLMCLQLSNPIFSQPAHAFP